MSVPAVLDERRIASRIAFRGRVELQMSQRAHCLEADSVNVSEGGVCVRVNELLEIRSPVLLRLFAQRIKRPVECEGRIAWVTQRLDLRTAPPFLYDVGVEFLRTSSRLRHFVSRIGVTVHPAAARAAAKHPSLSPATINGRTYQPQLTQDAALQHRWHVVVLVDGAPCFSRHYAAMPKAMEGWKTFKRDLQRHATVEPPR